jgi:signal transduction histidine kinase/tetratricopeptide (TPR) repeat protein
MAAALAGPIVGRDVELAELDAMLGALSAEASACVAIEGEPGIGKTTLLSELGHRAEESGCLVLTGAAAEFERGLPFGVWADALDAYVASQALDLRAEWPPDVVFELAEVLPSLRSSSLGRRESVADERYRSHRAVRRLLELLAADRPLVLVLDDLHWSDGASIELISALLRRSPDAPILFALAFRPSQAPSGLSAALAVRSARRIRLSELSENQAGELLSDLEPRAVAAIYRHGGGNPFYLEQLARAGEEAWRPPAAGGNGTGTGVPAAVAASLAEELASLSGKQRALLDAAAVAGEPFEPDLAAAIAELSAPAGLAALDALLALDLVRPTAVPRRFIFRHPLVRRAVVESAPGGWRLAAHARAAAALTARGAEPAECAHHVEQSASPGDENAIALLLHAGVTTASRAPAAAAHWFEAALRLLPGDDRERQVDVRVALAGTLRSLGELERCREILLDAVALLPTDALAYRVELTARCAAIEHWLGRHEDAHRRLARTWDELPDRSTPAAAALQIELAVDGLYELDFEQSVEMGRGALEASRETGDRVLTATAASALALSEAAAGEIGAARERREEALALVERLSDAELAPRLETLYYLGWAENYLEHYDDALAHADRGIAIARATGEGRLLVPMMLVKGYTFEMQGRVADAVELCEAAVEATRLSASPHELSWALCELAFAQYHVGDLEAAIAAAEESARVGGRMGGNTIPAGGGGPGWVLGMALFEAGEVERAWEIMHSLGSDDLPHKIPVERCFDWEILALVELALGRKRAAAGYVRRAEQHAALLGLRLPTALALRARAAVLLADDEPLAAAQLARESAEVAAAAGARLPAAFSLALGGRALATAGERAEAIKILRQAESELAACGSLRVRDDMRRELRRLGARAEPPALSRLPRRGLADLFRELRSMRGDALQAALARALGDPHLLVVHAGRDGTLPVPGDGRSVAPIERDGRQFAALFYDASLDDDPELVEAVSAAAAIALENERLQAESQARLAELQASRERIVAAGDAERRRLERNLHDGAQQQLVAIALQLRLIQSHIRRDPSSAEALVTTASDQLAQSLTELRELARGLHPAVLQHGIASALQSLAARSTVPTVVTCDVTERLPEQLELAAYFVACEALANVGKYSQASAASVSLSRTDRGVAIEIADDGIGGADSTAGTGLRGLEDRVEALGGHLLVTSPAGAGTVVTADLPCDSPPTPTAS